MLRRPVLAHQQVHIGGPLPNAVQTNSNSVNILTTKITHIADPSAEVKARYLGEAPQAIYLIRPDQHVVARWPEYDATAIANAIKTAIGKGA